MSEGESRWSSFAEEVWSTLKLIDVTEYVQTKGSHKLEYLPWANAWSRVMDAFPESDFDFDEPKFYNNGTGEQWVTVNIRRGDDVLTRRWWLPYLDYANKPVADPTAMQINNTRMRVLVKCLAMCGLGTELYSGEDIPDKEHDQQATTRLGASVLTPEQLYEAKGHIDSIRDAVPVAGLETKPNGPGKVQIVGFDKDMIDLSEIDKFIAETVGKADIKMHVMDNIDMLQNRFIRNYEKKKAREAQNEREANED